MRRAQFASPTLSTPTTYPSAAAPTIFGKICGLLVPDDVVGVFEKQKRAGFLRVEACVRAHIDAAVESGAALQTDETVLNWAAEGSGV